MTIAVMPCLATRSNNKHSKTMNTLHVSLTFAQFADSELDDFVAGIIENMTGNTSFTTPTVSMAALGTGKTNFQNGMADTAQGGTAATAAKNAARETLLGLLRQEAIYVQGACNNDLAVLLSSGFSAASTNHAQSPLETPSILKILNEASTQLVLRVTPITNAKAYEIRYSTTPGAWQPGGISTQARHIIVEGLTPGTVYTISVRAIGGSTGHSDWSDSVSHMCM